MGDDEDLRPACGMLYGAGLGAMGWALLVVAILAIRAFRGWHG